MFEPYDNPLIAYRPHGTAEINAIFGDPTRGGLYLKVPDPKWVKRSIVECHGSTAILPQLARYYWACHRLAEPSMREALRRVELVAPGYITERGGTWSYVFRRMRHDTPEKAKKAGRPLLPLSRHSWGIALDIEPGRNKAKTFAPGKTPKPWSPRWMEAWPDGVTPAIVEAMKSCGFAWGGDWTGYADPMHWELCGSNVQI